MRVTSSTRTIHVVFGDAASGGLRQAWRLSESDIVNLNDDLSAGPLSGLLRSDGQRRRLAWWKKISGSPRPPVPYDDAATLRAIRVNRTSVSYVCWCGPNATEQLGLRRFLASCPRQAQVTVVSWKPSEISGRFSLGHCPPSLIRKLSARSLVLSTARVRRLRREWYAIAKTKSVFRTWSQNEQFIFWTASMFDAALKRHGATHAKVPLLRLRGDILVDPDLKSSHAVIAWRVSELRKPS